MSPPLGRHSSSTLTSAKQPGWPNCPSGCSIRMKQSPDWGDDAGRKYSKFDPCRPDICDSMYKASSMALLRSRATDACNGAPAAAAVDKGGDQQYLEACRKIVEFMCALWREQKMCDVQIKAKDDSIQAHKLALGAHSDFLVTKFSEYPCGETVVVDMSEFDISTIMDLLRYVYTTELSISPSSIGPLLRASDELGITAVYEVCIDYMNDIKVDNAIYLYSIAESYGLTDIRDKSVGFIADNFVKVTNTEHFVLVPFAAIMELLSDDRLCISSELDVFTAVVRWIDSDRVERLSCAPELIGRAVRLQFVSPECLVKNVETVEWLFENPLCQAILFDVYKYHALNLSGSRLALAFPQQKERGRR